MKLCSQIPSGTVSRFVGLTHKKKPCIDWIMGWGCQKHQPPSKNCFKKFKSFRSWGSMKLLYLSKEIIWHLNTSVYLHNKHLARPRAMVSLSHFILKLIKHKVVYLISALSMVLDCHFNLLEPIWMHKIVVWSFFVFYHFS